jgi:hypothetical protein
MPASPATSRSGPVVTPVDEDTSVVAATISLRLLALSLRSLRSWCRAPDVAYPRRGASRHGRAAVSDRRPMRAGHLGPGGAATGCT